MLGGNSYTPGYLPNMALTLWSWDYSVERDDVAAVFVHEMVHVWQSGHGSHNALRGIYLWIKYDHITGDYDNSYNYDLASSTSHIFCRLTLSCEKRLARS